MPGPISGPAMSERAWYAPERDWAGNLICGADFMAGTICTRPPEHPGAHLAQCQSCGGDWELGTCIHTGEGES